MMRQFLLLKFGVYLCDVMGVMLKKKIKRKKIKFIFDLVCLMFLLIVMKGVKFILNLKQFVILYVKLMFLRNLI